MKPLKALILSALALACSPKPQENAPKTYTDRPPVEERTFVSPAVVKTKGSASSDRVRV